MRPRTKQDFCFEPWTRVDKAKKCSVNPSKPNLTLGERLCLKRQQLGWDMLEAANYFGICRTGYGDWERDSRRPSAGNIQKVLAWLEGRCENAANQDKKTV